ncbi:hypothetical protein ABK040_008353 [Willaertia magna]
MEDAHYAYKFMAQYYQCINERNKNALQYLYTDNSRVLWNGVGYEGKERIKALYDALPQNTDFFCQSIDAQAVGNDLLITSSGTVYYANDMSTMKLYSHQIYLAASESPVILVENFRWLSPCKPPKPKPMGGTMGGRGGGYPTKKF